MSDQDLSWGAKLCPVCNVHEIVTAKMCASCTQRIKLADPINKKKKREYMQAWYQNNKERARSHSKAYRAKKRELGVTRLKDAVDPMLMFAKLIEILSNGIHIHIHNDSQDLNQAMKKLGVQ